MCRHFRDFCVYISHRTECWRDFVAHQNFHSCWSTLCIVFYCLFCTTIWSIFHSRFAEFTNTRGRGKFWRAIASPRLWKLFVAVWKYFHSQFTFFRLSSSHLLLCFFVKTSSVVLFRSRFVARSLITLICLSERILSFFMRSFSIVFGLLHGWQKTYYSSARFSPKISPILIMCRRLSSSFVSLLSLFL